MVRYEDPPGTDKHLRFGKISQEIYDLLVGFPGVKSIVLHTHGAKGEHPHYHVWYEAAKAVTNQTVRNQLKKYNVKFNEMKSQNDWSFRNHDSWTEWAEYVCKNRTHEVLLQYKNIDEVSSQSKAAIPIVIQPITPGTPAGLAAPLPKKSISMRAKFVRYLEGECGWIRNETITLDNKPDKATELITNLTDYWENAFTTPQGVVAAEHAFYVFANDDIRDLVRRANVQAIKKCMRYV